jgi:4a-hydroxytetrahydrobiopterin dehydratase
MPQLNLEEVASALSRLGDWSYDSNALAKEWTFQDFREALAFVNAVAEVAEASDHHPDIAVNYNRVRLTLTTHSEGGVTEKDVDLARQIEDAGIGMPERRGGDRRANERREEERRRNDRRSGDRRG